MTSHHCEILSPLAGKRMTKFLPWHAKEREQYLKRFLSIISPEVRWPLSKMSVKLWLFLRQNSYQRPGISNNYNFFSFISLKFLKDRISSRPTINIQCRGMIRIRITDREHSDHGPLSEMLEKSRRTRKNIRTLGTTINKFWKFNPHRRGVRSPCSPCIFFSCLQLLLFVSCSEKRTRQDRC